MSVCPVCLKPLDGPLWGESATGIELHLDCSDSVLLVVVSMMTRGSVYSQTMRQIIFDTARRLGEQEKAARN